MKRLHLIASPIDNDRPLPNAPPFCLKCGHLLLIRENDNTINYTNDVSFWEQKENNCERIQADPGKAIRLSTAGKY